MNVTFLSRQSGILRPDESAGADGKNNLPFWKPKK
jgi:hypothetical protein